MTCNELLKDKDLVTAIRSMIFQVDTSNEELKLLSNTVFECLANGFHNQPVTLECVDPLSFDFGAPPSYSVLVWRVCSNKKARRGCRTPEHRR